MKRYRLYHYNVSDSIEEIEDDNGRWVKYEELVNDPDNIPSMQINELCRKLESLGTSIEKGQIESAKFVWNKMKNECIHRSNVKNCVFSDVYDMCDYNNCPLLKELQ